MSDFTYYDSLKKSIQVAASGIISFFLKTE